jgi:hypothetical protein
VPTTGRTLSSRSPRLETTIMSNSSVNSLGSAGSEDQGQGDQCDSDQLDGGGRPTQRAGHGHAVGDTPTLQASSGRQKREHEEFLTNAQYSLPLVTTYLFEVNPAIAKEWCELQTDFMNRIRKLKGASSVYALQRCPHDDNDNVQDQEQEQQDYNYDAITQTLPIADEQQQQREIVTDEGSSVSHSETTECDKEQDEDKDVNATANAAADSASSDTDNDTSTWTFRNRTPYHNFLGFGTYDNIACFENAFSNEHSVQLLETYLSQKMLSSFFILQMWHKYNTGTECNNTNTEASNDVNADVSLARDDAANSNHTHVDVDGVVNANGNGSPPREVDVKNRNNGSGRAGNFFMMRTNFLKPGARRAIVLRFLSRVAELSMQEEIKEPEPAAVAADGTGVVTDEAADNADADLTDTHQHNSHSHSQHSCVFYDILVSNNAAEYQTIVELVSWTSKEAYKIQKSCSLVHEKYDGMAKVAVERQTTAFWEPNEELLPEPT